MKTILLSVLLLFVALAAFCQLPEKLKIVKDISATSVKDQQHTGTCWDFATLSFIEAEALRMGKPEVDLSEMYIVRYTYQQKAIDFVRFGGKANFGEGGQAHDVLNVVREHGLVPQASYTGLCNGRKVHNHSEMEGVLESMVSKIAKTEKKENANWSDAIVTVIESYLGKAPASVTVNKKEMSPVDYAKNVVGFNPDQYLEITSFNHHPFQSKFALEIPDNWSHDQYLNLPIDELMKIIDKSLDKGYTVCWDGDVSEPGFAHGQGLATLPAEQENNPITQSMRQEGFDNGETTDDHLMHITGYAVDDKGVKYYKTKNSWNAKSNNFGGYIYLSTAYVRLKTIAIMVNKDVME